jgi:hypothetical protein
MADLRAAARRTVLDRYALSDLLPRHLRLIRNLVESRRKAVEVPAPLLAVSI